MEQEREQQRHQADVEEGDQDGPAMQMHESDDSEMDIDDSDIPSLDMTSGSSVIDSDTDGNSSYERKMEMKLRFRCFRYQLSRASHSSTKPTYEFKPLKLLQINHRFQLLTSGVPVARSGHRVIASESHLYSLGGYNPRSALTAARRNQCLLFQELWSYNFTANSWHLLLSGENTEDMPRELASNALVIHNNLLISHGGTGYPFGESTSNDCYVYTTGKNPSVTRLNVSGDLPAAQYGSGIVIHKHYLYTIGGTTGFDYSCDVYRLNLITKVWENMYICRPDMRDDPEARYRHEVVYDGHYIYVLGGGTSHTVYDLHKIPAFNLRTNRWDYFETLPDPTLLSSNYNQDVMAGFPKPRKCLSCVQHTRSDGDIEAFITGGLQGDLTTYFADIWKLNLRTKQWTWIRTAQFPKPLYFHSAAHSGNGCMYIFGGIEYTHKEMRRRNYLYKMWMTIPKLSEICWEAITHYNIYLDTYSHSALLKMGIPQKFVSRVPENSIKRVSTHDKEKFMEQVKRHRLLLELNDDI